jgi:membrane protease YdiL (CAAX protease family)
LTEPPSLPPPPLTQEIVPAPPVSRFGLALIVTVLGFGAFLSIGVVTQLLSVAFGLWWCEIVIFFGLPFVALKLSGREPLKALGLRRPWVAGAVFGFALGVTNFFAAAAPLQYLSQLLTPKSLLELYDAAQVFRDKGPLELAVIIGGVTIAAPLCEETFFRGLLQPGINEKLSVPLTIITTGMIFSFFHLDPVGFLARWELGIVFGLLAWRTGSLWPGIFMHLANNLTSTVLYFIARGEPDDGTNDPASVAAIAGVGGLLLLLVMLAARRFPSVLDAPARAEEVRVKADPRLVVMPWLFGAFLSLAALLAFDFRGSAVRAIDSVFPVKHPDASLKDARDRALRGDLSLGDYRRARLGNKDAGVTDAPAPPQ